MKKLQFFIITGLMTFQSLCAETINMMNAGADNTGKKNKYNNNSKDY